MKEMATKQKLSLAIPSMLLASLTCALMAALVKISVTHHVPTSTVIFWRSAVGLALLIAFMLGRGYSFRFWHSYRGSSLLYHCIRNVTAGLAITFFYLSLKHLLLTTATLLAFTTPLFMPIVAYIWEKKTIPLKAWGGIALGFVGVALVMHPGKDIFQVASVLALASGMSASIGQYAIHFLHRRESTSSILFQYFLFLTIAAGIATFIEGWGVRAHGDLLVFLLIGCLGLLYLAFLVYALRHAPPTLISPFLYTIVLFTLAIDWFLWRETVTWLGIVGILLVIAGVIVKVVFYPRPEEDFQD